VNRFFVLLSAGFLLAWTGAAAKTPDGQPPSQETVCDAETGAGFGLCNAYCEAMDCDSPNHHASDNACEHVKRNFERKTGRPLPCEATCPCNAVLPLFGQLASGGATVQQCFADSEIISVTTPMGTFAVVRNAVESAFCSVSLSPPFIALTATDALVCRATLRKAAEDQGVPCVLPE
jgi:hypothetical protein